MFYITLHKLILHPLLNNIVEHHYGCNDPSGDLRQKDWSSLLSPSIQVIMFHYFIRLKVSVKSTMK